MILLTWRGDGGLDVEVRLDRDDREAVNSDAAHVVAIVDAFEKASGLFVVPRVCSRCHKYMGPATCALLGATHGLCPSCVEHEERKYGLPTRAEQRGGPDGPVADTADGYRVSAAEVEEETKE